MTLAALLCIALQPNVIDSAKLDALVQKSEAMKSDCLVVMVDGKVVLDRWFTDRKGRIEAMSATKSVLNLAIGMLIKERKIKSLDQPVQDFFAEYMGDGKEKVLVRHLMNHTSGITARSTTEDIYSESDFVKDALGKPLKSTPGSWFFYNNRAVNLLAGLASKAAGEPVSNYLKRKLFTPLGITGFKWMTDDAGNPQGMAGFQVRPEDFAKIGNFLLQNDEKLLPKGWMETSTQPTEASLRRGTECGLLWWPIMEKSGFGIDDALLQTWRDAGMRGELVDRYAQLKGRMFPTTKELYAGMRDVFKGFTGPDDSNDYFTSGKVMPYTRLVSGGVHSYSAQGYLGQYLVVVPSAHLVAVRMRRGAKETESESRERSFHEFVEMVDALGR